MFESLDDFLQRLMVLVLIVLITLHLLRKLSETVPTDTTTLTELSHESEDQIDGPEETKSEVSDKCDQDSMCNETNSEDDSVMDDTDIAQVPNVPCEAQIVHLDKETPNTAETELIEDEMQKELRKCGCAVPLKMYRIGGNKYRFSDSKRVCLVRILRSCVMVRVGGGWTSLEEFLLKHDPCRSDRLNLISYTSDGNYSQQMASFKSKQLVK